MRNLQKFQDPRPKRTAMDTRAAAPEGSGSATMNSDLPEGSAGPGAEEDAESARDAGAAERYEAQAGTAGAEGPGKAPPQADSSVPTETGAPAESATPKRSAAPGAATGSVGRRP